MPPRAWITWSFLGFFVLVGGCRRTYTSMPVEGTISQGGKPLAGVQVNFFPDPDAGTEGPASAGITDAAGHYHLRTSDGATGAIVGYHRVCITKSLSLKDRLPPPSLQGKGTSSEGLPSERKKPKEESADPKLLAKYGKVKETPLRAEVRPGGLQTFDFDIK